MRLTSAMPQMALLFGMVACGTQRPLEQEQVCLEAEFAVASKVFECTGDEELAAEAADNIAALTCLMRDVDDATWESLYASYWHCPNAMAAAPCAQVRGNELDTHWWLTHGQDARCWQVYEEAPGPTTTLGTGATP